MINHAFNGLFTPSNKHSPLKIVLNVINTLIPPKQATWPTIEKKKQVMLI